MDLHFPQVFQRNQWNWISFIQPVSFHVSPSVWCPAIFQVAPKHSVTMPYSFCNLTNLLGVFKGSSLADCRPCFSCAAQGRSTRRAGRETPRGYKYISKTFEQCLLIQSLLCGCASLRRACVFVRLRACSSVPVCGCACASMCVCVCVPACFLWTGHCPR